jgi:hypothetical protein
VNSHGLLCDTGAAEKGLAISTPNHMKFIELPEKTLA